MFYEETQTKILELIENNELEKALGIIDEELKVPYVPKDFENFLIVQKNFIEQKLKINEKPQLLKDFDEQLERLMHGDQLQQISVVNNLANYNLRPYIKNLESYLCQKNVTQDLKTLVLLALEDQGIVEPVKVLLNNEIIVVRPDKLPSKILVMLFDQAKRIIDELNFDKNTSWETIAYKTALIFLLYNFPKINDISGESLGLASAVYANELLGLPIEQEKYFNYLGNIDLKKTKELIASLHQLNKQIN